MIDTTLAQPATRQRASSRPSVVRTSAVSLGYTSLAMSAVFMTYLTIVASGQVDPISSTMSNYVFVGEIGWLFAASVVGAAVGGASALLGMAGTWLLSGRLLRIAMCLAALATLLVAVFPTNRTGPLTLSAEIHRYAAGVAFCCVPVAALLLAARLNGRREWARSRAWLLRGAFVGALILVVFLTSHFGLVPESVQQLRGLFQRVMFLTQLAVLAQLLRVSHRAALPG